MSAVIAGATGNNLVVDTFGSLQANLRDTAGVALQTTQGAVSPTKGLPSGGINDGIGRLLAVDTEGGIRRSEWLPEFNDPIDGAVINTAKWTSTVTTYANAQANRVITLNSAAGVAANSNSTLISTAQFSRTGGEPLRLRTMARLIWIANAQMEIGFGTATLAATPTNGVYLKIGLTGQVDLVTNFGGAEVVGTISASFAGAGFVTGSYYIFDLTCYDDRIHLVVRAHAGTTEVAPIIDYTLQLPASQVAEHGAIAMPVLYRLFTSASVPASAPQLLIGACTVLTGDVDALPPFDVVMAMQSQSGIQVPAGAIASTANHANSTGPVTAAISNTAASYATLGGQWQIAAVAGAVTDYLLFSYPVPTGKRFICTGVRIETINTVVAVATSATVFQWGIGKGIGATLATKLFSATVGMQSLALAAAVGAIASPIDAVVPAFCVESGQHLQVSLNMPIGTATATELFRGTVLVRGFWL